MTLASASPAASNRLATAPARFPVVGEPSPVEWLIWDGLTAYPAAVEFMDRRVSDIAAGCEPETVLLLEHPPLYTAGTGASIGDLVDPHRFAVHRSGRGGQYTYHGPGQRVAYVMLDLRRRTPDVRAFVAALEAWLIETLAAFHVRGERREDRVGVWVRRPERSLRGSEAVEDKIAAIGIRIRRWVSLHGISLNVDPDLSHFNGIVPCGVRDHGVTSLVDLGLPVSMPEVDLQLRAAFEQVFGATRCK